jgi:hypothetical protein
VRREKVKFLLLIVCLFFMLYPVQGYCHNNIQVYVNGEKQQVATHTKEGIVYLPAVSMSMTLGTRIKWDPDRKLVTVNDIVVDSSPIEVEGVLFLPVEAIASSSGARVEWDGRENAIRIFQGNSGTSVLNNQKAVQVAQASLVPAPLPTKSYAVKKPFIKMPEAGITGGSGTGTPVMPGRGTHVPGHLPIPPTGMYTYPLVDYSKYALTHLPPGSGTRFGQVPSPPQSSTQIPYLNPSAVTGTKTEESAPEPAGKTGNNGIFSVTVTDVNYVTEVKDHYKPRNGFKFVTIYLSQKNVSSSVQVYGGEFILSDQRSNRYKHIENLSNFWQVVLRPNGVNSGYLIYEIPVDSRPYNLILEGLQQGFVTVDLM